MTILIILCIYIGIVFLCRWLSYIFEHSIPPPTNIVFLWFVPGVNVILIIILIILIGEENQYFDRIKSPKWWKWFTGKNWK